MANFRTKARAIDLLGKNQIADLPTAITELWKNGYDAYGDILSASLFHAGYKDVKNDTFTLSDDGYGMDEDDILNKWIVIGTDSKRSNKEVSQEDRFQKPIRVPLGEKGIGRLSVAYLGDHMLMITKKVDKPIQIVFMNWKVLENYEMFLDEVEIPLESVYDILEIDLAYNKLRKEFFKNFISKSWKSFDLLENDIKSELNKYSEIPIVIKDEVREHFENNGHGTYFVIFDPITEIRELEKEEKISIKEEQEKYSKQTSYIRSALSGLFNPFDEELLQKRKAILGEDISISPSFMIYESDGSLHDFLQLKDFFTIDEFIDCEHFIDGIFDENGNFIGRIKIYGNIQNYSYIGRSKINSKVGKIILKLAFWEGAKANTSMPIDKWQMYNSKAEYYSGLYVYRDGFRVLPYGRTDFDFLEFEKNRSKSAGVYYFSHRKMFGFIGITKKENPKLIDKSGREGFVSNEAYRVMKNLLMDFFKQIANDTYGSNAEDRKERIAEKNKEKLREKLIEDEKKKNYQQLIELRNKIKEKHSRLENIESEIIELEQELNKKIKDKDLLKSEEKMLLEEVKRLKFELIDIKVSISPGLSFAGNDSIQDLYYEFEEQREKLEVMLEKCNEKAIANAYINTLKEAYSEKYLTIKEKIELVLGEYERYFDEAIFSLKERIFEEIAKNKENINVLSPSNICIDELSEEQTVEYMNELDNSWTTINELYISKLKPMLEVVEGLNLDINDIKLLEAYKSKEVELSKKIDTFYELAQVGMSIEIIDHQFNVLYSQISASLKKVKDLSINNEKLKNVYNSLNMAFQHLESNHKMLMPMYRTTRRNKTDIYGRDIEGLILKFYSTILQQENISFICTNEFLEYSVYNYESIIMPVFLNIINNAIYWVGFANRDRIIKIDVIEDEILIMNSGSKMKNTELTRCFELFYSKKTSGRGIGLYLAKKCLNSVDMDIYATNDERYNQLGGACFIICKIKGE